MGRCPRPVIAIVTAVLLAACSTRPAPVTPNGAAAASPPSGWAYLLWTDPRWEAALPADWTAGDPTATTAPEGSLEPIQQANLDFANRMATSGATHFLAYGSIGGQQGGGLYVFVESGDASLDAFVERELELDRTLVGPATVIDRTTVVLAEGVATRLTYVGTIGDWPPFSENDYLFRLADGRSLTIAISGGDPASDPAALASFAGQVITTLRPVP